MLLLMMLVGLELLLLLAPSTGNFVGALHLHLMIIAAVWSASPNQQLVEQLDNPELADNLAKGLAHEAKHKRIQCARNGGEQLRGEHNVRVAGRQTSLLAEMSIDDAALEGGPAND